VEKTGHKTVLSIKTPRDTSVDCWSPIIYFIIFYTESNLTADALNFDHFLPQNKKEEISCSEAKILNYYSIILF